MTQLLVERHAALYSLGRLDEADEVYRAHRAPRPDPVELAVAACVQISSLTRRRRPHEAVALGLDLLRGSACSPPPDDLCRPRSGRGLERLYELGRRGPQPGELERPELTDPRIVAATRLINRLLARGLLQRPPAPWPG